jgi:ribonuclease Z
MKFIFAGLFSSLVFFTATPSNAQAVAKTEFKVTLLGTGSPAPVMRRFGPGVLVQAGGKNLVIDAGRGVTQRLLQAGLTLGQVDAVC